MKEPNTGTSKSSVRRLPDAKAVRADVADLERRVRTMAREQPLLMLAVALAGGYLVGRVVSRF